MSELFSYLGPLAVLVVVMVLLAGLWNMLRGGPSNRSQALMRWRVGLQFVAIIVLMTGLYFASR